MHDKILILDFGSQFTQLIARRIREFSVFCEILPSDISEEVLQKLSQDKKVKGMILSGSHSSVNDVKNQNNENEEKLLKEIFNLNLPILGICFGMQIMANFFGGKVEISDKREFGATKIKINKQIKTNRLFENIFEESFNVWMSHGDKVVELPNNFKNLAFSDSCQNVAMANEDKNFYALQFHPEVTHSQNGEKILGNFIKNICGARADWIMQDYVEEAIKKIKKQVGNEQVVLGLSGGVDSSVVATLIHKAIGNQLTCVFVDHGLLRLNESEQVMKMFVDNLQVKVIHVDASEIFFEKLAGVIDPEQKRKIIGSLFVDIFKAEAKKIKNAKFLAQGTIYPDVIESGGSKKSATIKSHHNVGGLPKDLNLKLLEPLRDLFKDEVRKLGLALGLPAEMINRHPFPGPGLGVRILGEVKKDFADLLRQADAIFIEELKNTKDESINKSWYELTSQAFAVFLPIKSVGVMGDGRTYEFVVSLRAVQTNDFMTADWVNLPYELLKKVSTRIINEVKGINRVTYDISSKPPATIEWE